MLTSLCASAQDDHFFIYLCFGQTNMVGHGDPRGMKPMDVDEFYSLSTIDGSDERKLGTWRKATPPLCGPDSGTSLVETFAYTIRRNLPRNFKIGIVYVAVDDTEIDLFDKDLCKKYIKGITDDRVKAQVEAYGGNPYERLVKMAKKAQKRGDIRGMLMQHGETYQCNDEWLHKVEKIYHNLMKDLNLNPSKVPFTVGETLNEDNDGKFAASNAIIDRLPDVLPNTHVASSKCCDGAEDGVHFTSTGYKLLGVRHAIQMLKGMGMGFESEGIYYTDCTPKTAKERAVAAMPKYIDVDGDLDKQGIFHFTATLPVTKVTLLTHTHKPFKTIVLNGATKGEINTNLFPKNQNPFMEFFAPNGASVEVEISSELCQQGI